MLSEDQSTVEPLGFAGLLSFVSKITEQTGEQTPGVVSSGVVESNIQETEQSADSDSRRAEFDSPSLRASTSPEPDRSWVFVAAGAALLIVLFAVGNYKSTDSPPLRDPSPTYPSPRPDEPPNPLKQPNTARPNPEIRAARTEDIPAPGDGLRSFTQGNIRWCLFQDRRLEIVRPKVEGSTDNDDVAAFNALVSDYNQRCGQYRYLETDMSTVRGEVATGEAALQLQADPLLSG